jgi:hypothetical protein
MSDLAPDLFGFADCALPAAQRSRVTNAPMCRQRGTTAKGRRLRDLYIGYMAALGHPTDIVGQTNCLKAAELVLAAETARASLLNGAGDANTVVRLENLADRAIRRLGLPAPGEQPHVPLRERLAAEAATGVASEAAAFRGALSMRERLAQKAA